MPPTLVVTMGFAHRRPGSALRRRGRGGMRREPAPAARKGFARAPRVRRAVIKDRLVGPNPTSTSFAQRKFRLAHISRTPARFDPAELKALSQRTLHKLDFESVRDRLAAYDI